MSDRRKIGSFAKVRRGASPRPIGNSKYFGGDVGWIRISDVTASRKYLRKTEQYVSPLGESLSVRVNKGDLVMSICGTIGRPIIIDFPSCIHDGFVQLYDIKNADTEYLYYILQFHEKDFERSGQPGTQVNLNTTIVENFEIFIPENIGEQLKIASILRAADIVIENTQSAISKYKAIKQGMLQDLFTRGIEVNTGKLRPKYKSSPELYKQTPLGWIPIEWKVDNIINTTYIKGRIGWEGLKAHEFINEGPYLITGTDFSKGKIDWSKSYHISEIRFNRSPNIHVKNEDVLITKDGTIGKTVYITNCPEKAILNSGLFILRCKNESYINKFLFYILNSFYFDDFIRKYLGGSTIVHLYQRSFEKFTFPIPSPSEQKEIIKRIDNINTMLEKEEAHLQKLQHLKSGLMSDLLTGKKKVNIK